MNMPPPTRPRLARWTASLAMLGASWGAPAAQLSDLPLEELMRVEVVSASRKTQRLADVPASMHVITAEDIRSSGARSLPEALRLVPGVDVAQLSGSRWGVSTRGSTGRFANKLLVLIDGRSVYSPIFSGVLWEAEGVPLDTIERIEVMHGPAGSIWGSNAVNGVINIITKDARSTAGGLVDASVGERSRQGLRARVGGSAAQNSDWRVGALVDRGAASAGTGSADANDAFRRQSADARWDRVWSSQARSTLEAQFLQSRSDELQTEGLYVPPYLQPLPLRLDIDRLVLAARHEAMLSPSLTASLRAAYSRERLRYGDRTEVRPEMGDLDLSAVWQAGAGHELTFGGGLRSMDIPARNTDWLTFVPEQRSGLEWSLYAQDEWTLVPSRWRLVAGARVDHDLYTGSHVQPNLRLLFTPDADVALWGALSRANRTLSRAESDAIVKTMVLPPGTPQNPGPLPLALMSGGGVGGLSAGSRYTDALELGLRAQLDRAWSVDLAGFLNVQRDDIGSGDPSGTPVFVATPQPHLELDLVSRPYATRMRGFEAAAEWRPAAGYRFQWGLSRFDVSTPREAIAPGVQTLLYATPRWLAHWRSVIDLAPGWRLDARLRHVGARGVEGDPIGRVEAFTALDATLTWRAGPTTELQLGGTNLLRPPTVEFQQDLLPGLATRIDHRVFLRWRQGF